MEEGYILLTLEPIVKKCTVFGPRCLKLKAHDSEPILAAVWSALTSRQEY